MTVSQSFAVTAFAALLAGFATDAVGQTCRSSAPLKNTRSYQAGLVFARGDTLAGTFSEFGGTALSGDSMAFGVVQFGRARYGSLNRASTLLGIAAGLEGPNDPRSRVVFCPTISLLQEWGPRDIGGSGTDLSILQIHGGLSVGAIAVKSGQWMIVPSAGLFVAGARYDFTFHDVTAAGQTESGSDRFGMATLAVGVVVNGRVSITPSVAVPFHAKVAKAAARVDMVVSFGGG